MKKFKNLSAKTIYSLLSLALGMKIMVLALNIAMLIYSFFSKGALDAFSSIPILVRLNTQGGYHTIENTAFIDSMYGSLSFFRSFVGAKILFSFCQMISTVGTIICLILVRRIIQTVIGGDPFTQQNGKRLKLMAMIIFLLPLLLHLISSVVANNVISQLKFPDIAIGYDFWDKGNLSTSLFAGLFLFVISEVFRIGTSLKEEQELTV